MKRIAGIVLGILFWCLVLALFLLSCTGIFTAIHKAHGAR